MDLPFPVQEVNEGAAHLQVPELPRRKGPGTAGPWPFYNPTMRVNRDLSAVVLAKWPRRLRSALDGLAACGAWGIRMRLETRIDRVAFNDRSGLAARVIRENLRRNRIDADVTSEDFVSHIRSHRYDFVDIDPFGPPTPFLAPFFKEAPVGTGFGVTATDTAVLGGTYPQACIRRYGARPRRCPQGQEIGLRILLGYCALRAADSSKSIRPILSFAAEHFLRVVGIIDRQSPPPLAFVAHRDGEGFVQAREADRDAIGPLWLGLLHDVALVRQMAPSEWTHPESARLLSTIQGEADLPPFFVTTDELATRERGSPPKLTSFLEGLRGRGHRAARTHFHLRGIRTDAAYDEILSVFRERMASGSTGGSGPAS